VTSLATALEVANTRDSAGLQNSPHPPALEIFSARWTTSLPIPPRVVVVLTPGFSTLDRRLELQLVPRFRIPSQTCLITRIPSSSTVKKTTQSIVAMSVLGP
jgi:hypothetical protein